jgi:putative transcriptional regulator
MMERNQDYFKIVSNNVTPSRGKILISEPFLRDSNFGRSVVLLIDHTKEGSMGLIMNKLLPMKLNDVVNEFKYLEDIPLYKGGPMGTDTLFYLHTLKDVEGALAIGGGLYLNGNFNEIKRYILQGNQIEGNIRFFLGYSGWQDGQLNQEIEENTWMIGKGEITSLMIDEIKNMWKKALGSLGGKYETWSHFPITPSLN